MYEIRVWLVLVQIFNAILLRFSRRLRNSPRPWVKHAQRPTTSDSLEKTHQKAKSSMSLQPHQNFVIEKSFTITFYILQFTFQGFLHLQFSAFLHLQQPRLVNNPG